MIIDVLIYDLDVLMNDLISDHARDGVETT